MTQLTEMMISSWCAKNGTCSRMFCKKEQKKLSGFYINFFMQGIYQSFHVCLRQVIFFVHVWSNIYGAGINYGKKLSSHLICKFIQPGSGCRPGTISQHKRSIYLKLKIFKSIKYRHR